jgi:DNA-binding response OmpR family regulator
VDLARDGVDGLHLALEGDYAVIVLDVMLPGLTATACCARCGRASRRR